LPFLRLLSAAEERAALNAMKEKRRLALRAREAEREAKHLEFEARKAEHEARLAEREARMALRASQRQPRQAESKWETESDRTASTEATSFGGARAVDEAEVERLAHADKGVRKLVKTLREIGKLEEGSVLEPLQAAKVAKKSELEVELDSALGLAKARARNDLRQRPSA
jgi:hypothetical protein